MAKKLFAMMIIANSQVIKPVTSLTQYEPDKDSIMVYSATLEWLLILVKV